MRFDQAIKFVIEDEGGYVDHRYDKGGETKYGISSRSYPDVDIKNLTLQEAVNIYKRDYWDASKVDLLPESIRYQYFDMCVNHGAGWARRILQRAAKVKDDGIIGPNTLRALNGLKNVDIMQARLERFADIVRADSNQIHFFRGWINRAVKVYKRCED